MSINAHVVSKARLRLSQIWNFLPTLLPPTPSPPCNNRIYPCLPRSFNYFKSSGLWSSFCLKRMIFRQVSCFCQYLEKYQPCKDNITGFIKCLKAIFATNWPFKVHVKFQFHHICNILLLLLCTQQPCMNPELNLKCNTDFNCYRFSMFIYSKFVIEILQKMHYFMCYCYLIQNPFLLICS